jgi:ligand-binding sensor domain-containing protein
VNSGLIDDRLTDVAVDVYDTLWFSTLFGISKFDGDTAWKSYNSDSGLVHVDIKAIAADGIGNVWLGTFGAGIVKFDRDTTWTYYTEDSGLVNNRILSLMVDSENNIWIGTYGGVSKFDGVSVWTSYTTGDLLDDTVRAIVQDGFGDFWFGCGTGVSRFDGQSGWTAYTESNSGIAPGTVTAIAVDSSGNLWFGHEYTDPSSVWISRYDGVSEWTTFDRHNGFDNNVSITDATVTASGDVWFATDRIGALVFESDVSGISGDDHMLRPDRFVLSRNYPNPFNSSTTIEYSLQRRSDVTVTIYNLLGWHIRTIVEETQASGRHTAVWDGTDFKGDAVGSGMYFYSIKAGDIREIKKMVLLK